MSIYIKKSDETSVSKNLGDDSIKEIGDSSKAKGDPTYSCVVCYEPYEKVILTSAQAENVFRVLCKWLRVKSGNTAFEFNRGADFPLCECCSEFALDLAKLSKRVEAIQEKIQEKVEEVIETIIETELARKEQILKVRDSHLEDIKRDRRVDGFRKQVIKSCEEIASSFGETEIEDNNCVLYDGDEDNKYAELFKNFRIKKEIFESDSLYEKENETEKTVVDLADDDNIDDKDQNTENTETVKDSTIIKSDIVLAEQEQFKEPSAPSIKIKHEKKEKDDDTDLPLNDTVFDSKLATLELEVNNTQVENEKLNFSCEELLNSVASTKSDDFLTLNYESPVVVPSPSPKPNPADLESDPDSNETTVFETQSACKLPAVSFERVLKISPSDDEKEEKNIKTTENPDVPAHIVPIKYDEVEKKKTEKDIGEPEQPLEKTLKKTRFSWGKVEYSDGKAFFQSVEINLLNKEKSRVQCSLCNLVTTNSKGRKAINKMRTHIVATHFGVYHCPTCNKKCKDNFNLLEHMKSHDSHSHENIPKENFLCKFCAHTCSSQSGLKMHVMRKHNEPVVKSKIDTISLAVVKGTISMVQQPTILEKVGNPITIKRKVGRPAKKRRGPGRSPKDISSSEAPDKSQNKNRFGESIQGPVKPSKPLTNISGIRKPTKRPSESGQFAESVIDSEQTAKKHRGPGRPRKSESLDNKKCLNIPVPQMNEIIPYSEISKKDPDPETNKCDIGAITIIASNKSSKEISVVKQKNAGPGRPRKTPVSSATMKSQSSTFYNETEDNSPNVCQSPYKSPPSPVPYIALSFNANSDSEESIPSIEEYFNAKSSNQADPLRVDEELGSQDTQTISRISSNSKAKESNANRNRNPWVNKPETIDIDLTESDTDVADVEKEDKMPIVTSTVSLAPSQITLRQLLADSYPVPETSQNSQPLLKQLLANPTIPSDTSPSFPYFSTTVPNFKVANENPTIPINRQVVNNTSSGVPGQVFSTETFPSASPVNSETASSLLKNESYIKYLQNLETHELKLLDIVRNRSNDCYPVAVLSNVVSKKLCCGSCGYQNQMEYENLAAALKAIKIHIYQKHFFPLNV